MPGLRDKQVRCTGGISRQAGRQCQQARSDDSSAGTSSAHSQRGRPSVVSAHMPVHERLATHAHSRAVCRARMSVQVPLPDSLNALNGLYNSMGTKVHQHIKSASMLRRNALLGCRVGMRAHGRCHLTACLACCCAVLCPGAAHLQARCGAAMDLLCD